MRTSNILISRLIRDFPHAQSNACCSSQQFRFDYSNVQLFLYFINSAFTFSKINMYRIGRTNKWPCATCMSVTVCANCVALIIISLMHIFVIPSFTSAWHQLLCVMCILWKTSRIVTSSSSPPFPLRMSVVIDLLGIQLLLLLQVLLALMSHGAVLQLVVAHSTQRADQLLPITVTRVLLVKLVHVQCTCITKVYTFNSITNWHNAVSLHPDIHGKPRRNRHWIAQPWLNSVWSHKGGRLGSRIRSLSVTQTIQCPVEWDTGPSRCYVVVNIIWINFCRFLNTPLLRFEPWMFRFLSGDVTSRPQRLDITVL